MTFMTQKTLSLTREAYERLSRLKKKDESFSQLILRLTGTANRNEIMAFAGIWKDDSEWDAIEAQIYQRRLHPHQKPSWV